MKRTFEAKSATYMADIPVRLHLRNDLHLARKLWHVAMGLAMVGIYMAGMPKAVAVTILGVVLLGFIVLETARLKIPMLNDKAVKLWGPLMRSHEIDRVSGLPFYVAGSLLAVAVFPKPIAVLSILYLACGDPVASLMGIQFGARSLRLPGGKSLVGTLSGIAVCMAVTVVFLSGLGMTGWELVALVLTGGVAGGAVELLPLDIDDNFSIPVVSGFVLWLTAILVGV